MVHSLQSIAANHFLNVEELEIYAKNSIFAQSMLNEDGTISTWDVDAFVTLARGAGVSREIPKV